MLNVLPDHLAAQACSKNWGKQAALNERVRAELKPLLCSLVEVKDKGYEKYTSYMLLIFVCAFVF